MNNINLIGRLTKDIKLQKTQSQLSVVKFTIAVDDPHKQKGDEQKTDFINCVAWKNQADVLNDYTRKGSLIGLTGALKQNSYTKSDGSKVTTYEVNCHSVYLLERKNDNQPTSEDTYKPDTELDIDSSDLPF